jgi:hypothetical protein
VGWPAQKSWNMDEYTVLDSELETGPPSPLPDASKLTWAYKKEEPVR